MGGIFDLDSIKSYIGKLKLKQNNNDFWDDPKKAGVILKDLANNENIVSSYEGINRSLEDNLALLELAEAEDDQECIKEIEEVIIELQKEVNIKKFESLFSGEADANDSFLEIHAGAGGTESHDWAEMLLRMYLRWSERHNFKTEIVSQLAGEEVGIKSVTIKLSGKNPYGWSKTESGVHRLVRISPFDSNSRRHTSFASVWVYPAIEDDLNIEIKDTDLRVDTYRASGAGGQHVNKTDSAIRITHIPTNIVVQCQNSRSQHRNREEAMNMLKSRLYELELRKKEAEQNIINSNKSDIGWGQQIRSYVLHPYQMVKDLRTNYETGNTSSVLDGDLDSFIMASLSSKVAT